MIEAPTQPPSGVDDGQRVDDELRDVSEGRQVDDVCRRQVTTSQ